MKRYTPWITFAIVVILFMIIACASCHGQPIDVKFLQALNQVEAGGKRTHVPAGDHGKAIGPFQIHKQYWQDSGVGGPYSRCADYDYSVEVVTAYLNKYAPKAVKSHDYQTLARVHNGGPRGASEQSTLPYWNKVKKWL